MRVPNGRKKSRDVDPNGMRHPRKSEYSQLLTVDNLDDRPRKGASLPHLPDVTDHVSSDVDIDLSLDQVRFADEVAFCTEGEETEICLDILRFGYCNGSSVISYHTEDGSARAGMKYVATQGELTFKPGECRQQISIAILDDVVCDPTVEFVVKLQPVEGCRLATRGYNCRVKVIDLDSFPTVKGGEFLKESTGWALIGLMREYFRRILWVPGMRWRTFIHFLFGQLHTFNFLLQVWMSKFIVDVVFNDDPETVREKLWFGSREWTGVSLAAFFVGPSLLVHLTDVLRCHMDLAGHTQEFLQRSLYRKSLDWSTQAQKMVKGGTLGHFLVAESGAVSSLYLNVLHLMRVSTKILATLIIFFHDQKVFALPVLLFPLLAFLLGRIFWRSILNGSDSVSVAKEDIVSIMHSTNQHKTLINDYMKRPSMNEWMAGATTRLLQNTRKERQTHINVGFCFPHLAGCICAFYIIADCTGVLCGLGGYCYTSGSAGEIVATIQLALSLGEDFKLVFENLIALIDGCSSLRTYCTLMNLQSDSVDKKRLSVQRMDVMRQRLATWERNWKYASAEERERVSLYEYTNQMTIELKEVVYQFPKLENVAFSSKPFHITHLNIAQGTISAVLGPLGAGKNTLIKILGDVLHPRSGYFAPPHLKILHVDNDSRESMVFKDSLWLNLTFGSMPRKTKVERVRNILHKFHSKKLWQQFDMECENDFEFKKSDLGWWETLSNGEFAIVNLARALVSDPHIIVIEHPFRHFNQDEHHEMLTVLQEFVQNRGIEADGEAHTRRPHTCIYSSRNAQYDIRFVHQVIMLETGSACQVIPGGLWQSQSASNSRFAGENSTRAPPSDAKHRDREDGPLDPVILL